MKLFEAVTIVLITVVLLSLIGGIAHKFSSKEHFTKKEEYRGEDAPVEEFCEDVIDAMGYGEKDLTPESPDKDIPNDNTKVVLPN